MNNLSAPTKVSIVTAACLVGLVVALRDLVRVPAEVIARDIVPFMIVYWAIALYPGRTPAAGWTGLNRPLYRGALIILMPFAIVLVYALRQP
ncbi:MAG: hypothetical protein IT318_13150 [Anaerolineales bacterium]|nr:hypothetical protein [Anaerolineales bacterium]